MACIKSFNIHVSCNTNNRKTDKLTDYMHAVPD